MATLSGEEIDRRLANRAGWERTPDGAAIAREWKLADFASAVAFVNRVADAAEAANHHPDVLLHGWNRVRLTLSTHSEGGVTGADFSLATQIDSLS